MKRALVWFRNDLRVQDNVVLHRAAQEFDEVYPVYCFDEREFSRSPIDIPRTGPFRSKFLLQSVDALRQSLRELGSDLIIRQGDPVQAITQLAEVLQAHSVLASKEATSEEVVIEQQLEKVLWGLNIDLRLTWQSTLYGLDELPFPIKHLPEVFTSFRKRVEKESSIADPLEAPRTLNLIENINCGALPTMADLGQQESACDDRSVLTFVGGEKMACERLTYYLWETDLIADYKQTRNGLLGGDYSSKLSPWLALGCISPKSIYQEVKKYEQRRTKNSSTYWLIFELVWRDYFRFVAHKHGTALFRPTGIRNIQKPYYENLRKFDQWMQGETGVPFVDANMKELNATGFMSNRGRQIVASYLVNDLHINWTWGAWYFESLLIDYDPTSNWGNWNYVAGVGNDPRQDRYFNIESQASRYDPQGDYVNHWLGEQPVQP